MTDEFEILEEPAMVSVRWEVKNFFSLCKESNYSMESPAFSLSGANWYLEIYPNGHSYYSVGWISLYLHRKCYSSEKPSVSVTLGITKPDGSIFRSTNCECEYTLKDTGCGSSKLVQYRELQEAMDVITSAGSLVIFCTATVNSACLVGARLVDIGCQTAASARYILHYNSAYTFQKQIEDMFICGCHSDFTLKVRDQEFKVHRNILAASSFEFSCMLKEYTKKKKTGPLYISDLDPISFKDFLRFIYTGDLNVVSVNNSLGLYKAADKYGITDLRQECARRMSIDLSLESFFEVIVLTSLRNEYLLLESVINFFIENVLQIFPCPKWQLFMQENSKLAQELLIKLINEKLT